MNSLRTGILMAAMTGLFLAVGYLLGERIDWDDDGDRLVLGASSPQEEANRLGTGGQAVDGGRLGPFGEVPGRRLGGCDR